jgi:hypothetical protein
MGTPTFHDVALEDGGRTVTARAVWKDKTQAVLVAEVEGEGTTAIRRALIKAAKEQYNG